MMQKLNKVVSKSVFVDLFFFGPNIGLQLYTKINYNIDRV